MIVEGRELSMDSTQPDQVLRRPAETRQNTSGSRRERAGVVRRAILVGATPLLTATVVVAA